MKVLVIGGNGYVGKQICKEFLPFAHVVSLNRSGAPSTAKDKAHFSSKVEWLSGDVLQKESWREALSGTDAVVSVVGGFGSNQQMERICGDTNIAAAEAAAAAGVKRFVFISAHK